MKKHQKIFFCVVILISSAVACLYFIPETIYNYQQKYLGPEAKLSQWISIDRPTLVYALPPATWIGETESMTSLLMTAKKMGWNLVSAAEAKKLEKDQLKNAFGLFILISNYCDIVTCPKYIPIVALNNIAKLRQANNPLNHLRELLASEPYNKNLIQSILPRIQGLLVTGFPTINMRVHDNKEVPQLKFIMNWYLTLGATYHQPKINKLMFCGVKYPQNMRSESAKYIHLWKKLDKMDYFVSYGPKEAWDGYQSYQGYIPADGVSFVNEINKNGICLILHNQIHLTEGTPSGRIFEAAAAAAIIIADKHPFLEKEFGNSLLYIDQTRDDLFEQIDTHMQWIKSHPTEAKDKARLAHAIFLQKFTQEQQLARLYEHLVKGDIQ